MPEYRKCKSNDFGRSLLFYNIGIGGVLRYIWLEIEVHKIHKVEIHVFRITWYR